MDGRHFKIDNPDDNSKQALEAIMIKYGSELSALAYSYVKNAEEAKDIVQNVFVSAFMNWDKFRGDSSVKTWLYRMTINKCKDYLKSSRFKRLIFMDKQIESPDLEYSAYQNMIDKELSSVIKSSLFKLKVKHREVIFMRYYQDLSVKEIASILGIPEASVHSRLRRAKGQLAPLLEMEVFHYE